jgi:hypothetical protein
MGKRYYTQEEACAKLEMTPEQLKEAVRSGELREFRDAGKINYKADEVDKLAAENAESEAAEESGFGGSLSGSLSSLDLLGTGELRLEDSSADAAAPPPQPKQEDTGDDSMELKLAADDDTKPGAAPPKESPPLDLGSSGSDSLSFALDDTESQDKGGSTGGTGELMLEPIDEGDSGIKLGTDADADAVSLEDTTTEEGKDDKEGTVVSSIGVSVFDDDDVESEADPLAKTVVSGGSGALGIEGVGSGSGLLDLTRESDDTSLGAELLDEIYPGEEGGSGEMGEATRAGLEEAITERSGSATFEPVEEEAEPAAAAAVATRTRIEFEPDAVSSGLTGMLFVGVLVMCLAGLTAAAATQGVWPSLLQLLSQKILIVGGAALVAAVAALAIGFFAGKKSGS